MRTTKLLIAGLAVSVALLTFAPATSATHLECGAETNLIVVGYHCTVHGAGVTGTVQWCPDNQCASTVHCEAEVNPLHHSCTL